MGDPPRGGRLPVDAPVEAAAAVLGPRARRSVPLGPLTTYRVGGPAALLVEAATVGDLLQVAQASAASGLDVLVVGRGSNMLVADAGFRGIAVVLVGPDFARIVLPATGPGRVVGGAVVGGTVVEGTVVEGTVVEGTVVEGTAVEGTVVEGTVVEGTVVAGGSVHLPVLARRSAAAGLRGLEWAVGVPGSVGGAVRMNAGGHGSDVAATLRSCQVVDLQQATVEDWPASRLAFGYRRSAVGAHHVVVAATFELAPGDREEAEATIREIVRWRREHQPGGQNAGSVFTNPPGQPPRDSAGWLIDAAGLKGERRGSAMVSDKHANFIQAEPGGSADDVVRLMDAVRCRVAERFGVELQSEVRLVGFDAP